MSADEFIPTGRTASVSAGLDAVQVQTEYAPNPSPRITTTVFKKGRVLHKVEIKLKRSLATTEECKRAEAVLARQHGEVISIIKDQQECQATCMGSSIPTDLCDGPEQSAEAPITPDAAPETPKSEPSRAGIADAEAERYLRTTAERLRDIPGVEYVFHLDNAGNFFGQREETQFRKSFRKLARNVRDLIDVFTKIPGSGLQREAGVFEVERDRLYVASSGEECYFVTVIPADRETDYETAIKRVVAER